MKSYSHLFEECIAYDTRLASVYDVANGRKKMKCRWRIKKYTENMTKTAEKALKWITNFEPYQHDIVAIQDKYKMREIIVPTLEELTVQHCSVRALMPMFRKGMYEHSYASIPGRGSHLAKEKIEKWIRKDPKNFKYILKMDIHHFFASIDHDILMKKFKKYIKDKKMLDLLQKIVNTTDEGLPLGFYTSQWFANWLLQDLDHYIKEDLEAAYYVRYMDDMVITGSNKRRLHTIQMLISSYLEKKYHLTMKDNWQVFRFDYIDKNGNRRGRDLDFMGFRFFRDHTELRKSIAFKIGRKALKISKKDRPTAYDAKQFMSYYGYLAKTDTNVLEQDWVNPYVSFKQMKGIVSKYDKNMNKIAKGEMQDRKKYKKKNNAIVQNVRDVNAPSEETWDLLFGLY